MSKIQKRKHVLREMDVDDYSPPTANQQIVRVVKRRGNNLHEVQSVDQTTFLVSMPTKFRKVMWVTRGSYVVIEPIEEGVKVKAEIVKILTTDHIRYYKQDNVWPTEFDEIHKKDGKIKDLNVTTGDSESSSSDDDDDDDDRNENCGDESDTTEESESSTGSESGNKSDTEESSSNDDDKNGKEGQSTQKSCHKQKK